METKTEQARVDTTASLTSQTYRRIRNEIISGTLKPGRKLKIEVLRRDYGIGASPIREALSLLTSDRLVERIDQRGFRVAGISADAYGELLKTRCWLEERALRESVRNGDKVWEEQIVLAQHHLSRTDRSSDTKRFVSSDDWEAKHRRFHMALIAACGSSFLLAFCEQLYDQNIRYRNIAGATAYPKRDITQEHESIVSAALDRDGENAVKNLIDHYRATGEYLSQRLG